MAHTRRPSARQGLPLLTLAFIGVLPIFSAAQNADQMTTEIEAAPIVIDMVTPLEIERALPPPTEPSALGVYRDYIESMEANAGAFAPGLTEQLLGLGLNLQALDRHAEAADVLQRGVHVSRVQAGLNAAGQIPLLRAEIRSLTALEKFDEVDEHQRYLARVESKALKGTPALITALVDQGAWAEQAWELGLGDQETHPEHLLRSWEYYRLAYDKSAQLFGERSLELLKPLEGMLRLQYRFATMQSERAGKRVHDSGNVLRSSSLGGAYRRGEAVLSTILGIKLVNGSSASEQAHDLTRLGDWARWMGRRSDARGYYEKAWQRITPPPEGPDEILESNPAGKIEEHATNEPKGESPRDTEILSSSAQLAKEEKVSSSDTAEQIAIADAPPEPDNTVTEEDTKPLALAETQPPKDDPHMRAALFETATPLPDIDTLRPLPPFRRDASGPLIVQFQLNNAGKITSLEQIAVTEVTEPDMAESEEASVETSAPQVDKNPEVDRLLRKIRRTRFRPRYEEGAAVETDMIVWSFDLNQASTKKMALQQR